jgi:tyrosyl-tRNA synthetase
VLSGAEIDANARTYQEQAFHVLSDDPELLEVRFNSEWLDMSMEELFRLARTTTVAQLLERDDFAKRWSARAPISILELLYPLLQGYDSVAVRSDVELGGTDQTFNLLLARDIQRAFGQPEQAVLTMPLLPGVDGVEKMSKSVGNHIGITEPPGEIYGRTLSLPDEAMDTWFELLAVSRPPEGTSARDMKHALAHALVARFYGPEAADAAAAQFERVHVQRSAPEEIEELRFDGADGEIHLPALIAEGFGMSRSDARRMLAQGGVRLDGEPLGSDDLDLPRERVDGAVLQVGKRHFRRVRVGS